MRTPAFWYAPKPTFIAALLWPLSQLYRFGLWLDRSRHTPYKAAVPVISVGNITAGGSGKTPLVVGLAKALTEAGHKVAVLSRGYGVHQTSHRVTQNDTANLVGDEPTELFNALPNVQIWVGRDRTASAKAAVTEGATLLILDDGMQHWKLARDIDLLVLSARHGIGNGLLIPAGPMREPKSAAKRVDAVVIMGSVGNIDQVPPLAGKPAFNPKLAPENVNGLTDKPVIAFCGLGLPDKFFKRLEAAGLNVVENIAFADHHPFTAAEINRLKGLAEKRGAHLVTTTKDIARIAATQREGITALSPQIQPESLKGLLAFIEGKLST